MKRLAAGLALLALAGCGGTSISDVPWDEYAPQVHREVSEAISSGDCQAMDDLASRMLDGDDAHRARYGHGNSTLVSYLDDAADAAGC